MADLFRHSHPPDGRHAGRQRLPTCCSRSSWAGRWRPAEYGVLAAMLGIILIIATPMDALRTAMAHFARAAQRRGATGDIRRLRGAVVPRAAPGSRMPVALSGSAVERPLAAFFRLDAGARRSSRP